MSEGFETYLIEDACRGVELKVGDVQKALNDMLKEGVNIIKSFNLM